MFWKTASLWTVAATVALTTISLSQFAAQLTSTAQVTNTTPALTDSEQDNSPNFFLPCSIVGYWLSNIVGILLMQVGAVDVFQGQPKERNLKKELLTGLVSSTIYTIVILALIQFKILDTPVLFSVMHGE